MEEDINKLSLRIADLAAEGESDSDEYHQILKRYGDIQDRYTDTGGFTYKSEMKGILNSMAFGEEYYDKPIKALSGGERTRLALACLLMEKPDVLMLDEPTNHLDIGMLKWLEQFLRSYSGTVVLVSHDRYFLDQFCTRIFEVENHKLRTYTGNYTDYARIKRENREAQIKAYNKQQGEIKRQEDMIRRFKERGTEHLAKRAASREKRLAQMDILDKPDPERGSIRVNFKQEFKSGNDVLYGENLSRSFDDGGKKRELFHNVNFDIKRGDRICIVGPNGIGKTTLLKMIMGEAQPTTGEIRVGHNVEFAYYDQRQQQLDPSKTVMEEIHDSFSLYKDSEVRGLLGRFLFKADQVFTEVGSLSGGEKARLALLKLMLSGANVLLLDEPTNHLDIESKEIFEDALREYEGTIVAVSHDRYFLNRVASKIFELNEDGMSKFEGGYDYYEEKKAEISSGRNYIGELRGVKSREGGAEKSTAKDSMQERAEKKRLEAEARRKERARQKLEDRIEELEQQIADIEAEMCKPAILSDAKRLASLDKEHRIAKQELDESYELWAETE